jgi:hypothetical protein
VVSKDSESSRASGWFQRLQEHSQKCREALPIPDRHAISAAQEVQCQIVGGSLISWLQDTGPQFLTERRVLAKMMKVSPDPGVVFTSNMPGLVAAAEILGNDHEGIEYLLEDEYAQWIGQSPDATYRWHVHVWSRFRERVEPEFEKKAKQEHPLPPGCTYWQHTEGTMWGKLAGRGGDHLWQWDGTKPELLEEAFTHWVS